MGKRTYNTLFMLMSLDGKISTGAGDGRDVDKDYGRIEGIREGIRQYYEREQQTDLHSLNSGKVMAKIGANSGGSPVGSPELSFIIVDNSHLTEKGVLNLAGRLKKLYLVTKNPNHPAKGVRHERLAVLEYEGEIDFADLFEKLRGRYGVERVTIQSGGSLNAVLLRAGLIDELSVVVAPALAGGRETPTLIDGRSLVEESELADVKALKLRRAEVLENSYLHLFYEVVRETRIV